MRDNLRLGRVWGIPVSVNWSVIFIVLLLSWSLAVGVLPSAAPGRPTQAYWLAGIAGSLLLIGSLLAHELAHAVVARRSGVEVDGLTLWLFGGVASLRSEAKTPGADFRIAAVGQATSLVLGMIFGLVGLVLSAVGADALIVAVASWLANLNIVLAVFNLLPGAPLDGGRVLRSILWARSKDRDRAAATATIVGQVLAYTLVGLGLLAFLAGQTITGLWTIMIGWFLLSAARAEHAASVAQRALRGVTVADVMSTPVETGYAGLTVAAFIHRHVLGGRHSAYPVVDQAGNVEGLLTLAQLRDVPGPDRSRTPVHDIALPLADVPTCGPTEPLGDVLTRLTRESGQRALVFDHGHLVGIVTPADVARILDTRSLLERRA